MKLRAEDHAALAGELVRRFLGARVQKAWSPARAVAVLQLKPRDAEALYLLVRSGGPFGRLALLPERPPPNPEPPPFQALLRRHLEGAALSGAEVQGPRLLLHFTGLTLVAVMEGGGALAVVEEGRVRALDAPRGAAPQDLLPGKPWAGAARPEPVEGPTALRATLDTADATVGAAERAAALKETTRPLQARLERTRRTLEKIRAELSRGAEADAHRRKGELLKQNLHKVKRGQKDVEVEDWLPDGTVKRELLALDPKKSGPEQVEWHFHQARRLDRGAEIAKERLVKLEAEARDLEARLSAPAAAAAFATVREAAAAEPGEGAAKPYREYRGHGGCRIRVGKGPKGNDTLTLKLARPDDLWLHARGAGGAHVVVSLEKGQELPQEALLDAAHLALFHSNLKGEPRGEVTYARARFVRKPKGSAPGLVAVTRDKTFWVRVEDERLKRLIASEV